MATFLEDLAEDLDLFFDDFGQSVTVGGATITAIFDNPYKEIDLQSGQVASRDPQLHCKTSDVTGATKGTTAVVDAVNYTVAEPPMPDGHGMTTLVLKKA